ncbi:MAG TPA: DUF3526 domain-containing protein, partial [Polyangiales bacterium]|nr:DUF3526 domain-containing protein [Polyangiales bacterium]
ATDAVVAAARAPVEQKFFRALAHRQVLVTRLASASPVTLVAIALDELAGASDARVDRFRHEVDAFQRRFAAFFNAKTMHGERLTPGDLEARPRFAFEEHAASSWPTLVLAIWTLALLAFAVHQLPRALALDERRRRPASTLRAGDPPRAAVAR